MFTMLHNCVVIVALQMVTGVYQRWTTQPRSLLSVFAHTSSAKCPVRYPIRRLVWLQP